VLGLGNLVWQEPVLKGLAVSHSLCGVHRHASGSGVQARGSLTCSHPWSVHPLPVAWQARDRSSLLTELWSDILAKLALLYKEAPVMVRVLNIYLGTCAAGHGGFRRCNRFWHCQERRDANALTNAGFGVAAAEPVGQLWRWPPAEHTCVAF
jgi:hypothetical protein